MSTTGGEQQPSNLQEEHALRAANDEWATALAHKDGSALARIMSDDFVLAYPFEGDDKDQFISDILNGELKVESLEPHDVTFRVSASTGIVFGSETANWYYRGRDLSGPYRFVRVYLRGETGWQILALHLCLPSHR
jgi:ketosteroid isomerase-like protein